MRGEGGWIGRWDFWDFVIFFRILGFFLGVWELCGRWEGRWFRESEEMEVVRM